MTASQWYYATRGQRHGPVSGKSLKSLADCGELLPSDLVWKEGMKDWVQAESISGLITTDRAPPPLPRTKPSDGSEPEPSVTLGVPSKSTVRNSAKVAKLRELVIEIGGIVAGVVQRILVALQSVLLKQTEKSSAGREVNTLPVESPENSSEAASPSSKNTLSTTSKLATGIGCLCLFGCCIFSMIVGPFLPAPPPRVSGWDGSVQQVKDWLYNNVNDPDSLQFIEWSKMNEIGDGRYEIRCKYRAKNAFGGYVVENKMFYLDSTGNVIGVF